MKTRARSIIGRTTLGTCIWAVAFVAFNAVLFLIFDESKLTVTAMSLSLIAFAISLLNFLYGSFFAILDREVALADDDEPADERETHEVQT